MSAKRRRREIVGRFIDAYDAMIEAHICPECYRKALVVDYIAPSGMAVNCNRCGTVISYAEAEIEIWKRGPR